MEIIFAASTVIASVVGVGVALGRMIRSLRTDLDRRIDGLGPAHRRAGPAHRQTGPAHRRAGAPHGRAGAPHGRAGGPHGRARRAH